jgi:hypothetical protein
VYEEANGWARISKYFDVYCSNGVTDSIDEGNRSCSESNGLVKGQMAQWVSARYLSTTRPPDPAANASAKYNLVKGSDDFRLYKDEFAAGAQKLIQKGRCKPGDFIESGGWMRSTSKGPGMYFTYCGGWTRANQVTLNVRTGAVR